MKNQLTGLPDSMGGLASLRELDLMNNQLRATVNRLNEKAEAGTRAG